MCWSLERLPVATGMGIGGGDEEADTRKNCSTADKPYMYSCRASLNCYT